MQKMQAVNRKKEWTTVGMSMIGDRFLPKNMKHQIWKAQPMEGAAGDRNRLGFPALT